jgi:hypothetical protein
MEKNKTKLKKNKKRFLEIKRKIQEKVSHKFLKKLNAFLAKQNKSIKIVKN